MTYALIDLLVNFYLNGNFGRMEAIARSMLLAVPNDIVALQFLALSLYLRGRTEDAYKLFNRYVSLTTNPQTPDKLPTSCQLAENATYLAATRPGSGLATGWYSIAEILSHLGYGRHALRARKAARVAAG